MKSIQSLLIVLMFTLLSGGAAAVSVNAQAPKPAPTYKIANVKIVPFDGQTGKFQDEIKPNEERSFFNEISLSMFVTVEVSGQAGTFEAGRMVEITVLEGTKQRVKKTEQIGLIGDGGKFYIPVFLDSAFCSELKVTARIVGQKTASTMTRKAMFVCGE